MLHEILIISLFVLFSIVIAIMDIKAGMIPRLAFVFAFPLFSALVFFEAPCSPAKAFAGAMLGLFVFLLAFFISKRKLGLADVWYSALTGLVLGPSWWYLAMCCACISAIVILLILKRCQIPFIPFMALGSIVMIIIQKRIIFF